MTTHHPFSLSPSELKEKLDRNENIFLLDVREIYEVQLASLNAVNIPLGELSARVSELGDPDANREVVVLCHHGIRSATAVNFLRDKGFLSAKNLRGGIDRWSLEIDPSVPRYGK